MSEETSSELSLKSLFGTLMGLFDKRPILTLVGLLIVLAIVLGIYKVKKFEGETRPDSNQVQSIGHHNQSAGKNDGRMVQENK